MCIRDRYNNSPRRRAPEWNRRRIKRAAIYDSRQRSNHSQWYAAFCQLLKPADNSCHLASLAAYDSAFRSAIYNIVNACHVTVLRVSVAFYYRTTHIQRRICSDPVSVCPSLSVWHSLERATTFCIAPRPRLLYKHQELYQAFTRQRVHRRCTVSMELASRRPPFCPQYELF